MKNNSQSKAPHLIVIGAQKSGTTWLQHVMDTNDQFFVPAIRQEVSFFSNYWEKGMSYYNDLYKKASPNQVTADVSPRYQEKPSTPERINEFVKQTDRKVKMILICREPVSRLGSAYKMYIKQGHGYKSLKEGIQKAPNLIEKGLYNKTLEAYYKTFSPEDILVLFFDDLKKNSDELLKKVQNFCGLPNVISNNYENVRINNGGKRKSVLLSEIIRYSGRTFRAIGLTSIIHKLKKTKVVRNIRDFNEIPFELSDEDKEYLSTLQPLFVEDVLALSKTLKDESLLVKWGYNQNVMS